MIKLKKWSIYQDAKLRKLISKEYEVLYSPGYQLIILLPEILLHALITATVIKKITISSFLQSHTGIAENINRMLPNPEHISPEDYTTICKTVRAQAIISYHQHPDNSHMPPHIKEHLKDIKANDKRFYDLVINLFPSGAKKPSYQIKACTGETYGQLLSVEYLDGSDLSKIK
ncbi:MAG: hypothetical protein WC453_00665 [Patescibacteria group bacterium]